MKTSNLGAALKNYTQQSSATYDPVFDKQIRKLRPDWFVSPFRSIDDWVTVAEQLAYEHEGILPNMKWLDLNEYSGLAYAIRNNREKFSHINQKSPGYKSIDDWVSVAEELADKNKGKLPKRTWLESNGFTGLITVMYHNPEKFSHILRDLKKGKSPQEWAEIAEELALKHGGLPPRKWLRENGFASLCGAMDKHKSLFDHIQKQKTLRNVDEWVEVAEELASKNNGILHNQKRLGDMGYTALARMIACNRSKFRHIPQEIKMRPPKERKSSKEWVEIAEELSKNNNGTLPAPIEISKMGMGGLRDLLYRKPELFAHIPQSKRMYKKCK